MKNEEIKHKIQFFNNQSGIRSVLFGDVIAFLYERGQDELARELIERGEWAFDLLESEEAKRDSTVWTASYTAEPKIEKPLKKKWYQF